MPSFQLVQNVVNPNRVVDSLYLLPSANGSVISGKESQDGPLSFIDLSVLTLQAVFETVLICSFGYIAARSKILTPSVQKHLSTLNVNLFTPCLVFSKLASSLSLSALVDIAVIPVLFVFTTLISLMCARVVSRFWRFNKAETNFVTAMAVFGNSNSLPVSLTVNLAYTLPNLLWPDIEGDNSDDVASRGILYLLIFQQLGQIVRWSWGYNTLLAKPEISLSFDNEGHDVERQVNIYIVNDDESTEYWTSSVKDSDERTKLSTQNSVDELNVESSSSSTRSLNRGQSTTTLVTSSNTSGIATPLISTPSSPLSDNRDILASDGLAKKSQYYIKKWTRKVLDFMNPPLWAMLIAIVVASIPQVKYVFFERNGFIQNTATKAVSQLGSIAIPMILLVLGSNLAPNESTAPASPRYGKIVAASLLCRMILPSLFLLPTIAFSVKYINISILDDPIFLLVAFILTVSPPAIQLSQICQLNQVFEKEMAGVLFWGYVVLILPATIAIVIVSLDVLNWAGTTL